MAGDSFNTWDVFLRDRQQVQPEAPEPAAREPALADAEIVEAPPVDDAGRALCRLLVRRRLARQRHAHRYQQRGRRLRLRPSAMTLSPVDMSTAQVSARGERPGHDPCRWPLRRDAVGVHRRLARASLRDRPELGDPVDADEKRVSTAPSGAPPQLASTAPQISSRWNPRPLLVGGDELSRHRAAGHAASLSSPRPTS